MSNYYQPADANEIKQQILRDIRLAAIDAGVTDPPVEPGTDWDFLATAVANVSIMGFANLDSSDQDTSVLDATGDALDQIRQSLELVEVPAVGATGQLTITVAGNVTIPSGQEFVYPSGLRGTVTQEYVNPADQSEVTVAATDTGTKTNLAGGQVVTFRSPPVNLTAEAKVSTSVPLTGGTDAESDDRKRDRILNELRNKPAGGNWGHIRKIVLDNHPAVQDCYVYPALGGPGSVKVVPVKDFDTESNDYSRAPSSDALTAIRTTIQEELGIPEEVVVQAPANLNADYTIKLEIPAATLNGGAGTGWTDTTVWPTLETADGSTVTVTAVNATKDQITVDAATTTAPVAGQTHIAWWSPADRKFYTALVTDQTGATTAWVLTLDRPLLGIDGVAVATGDYISPAAENMDKYGDAWVEICRKLGPGENTTDANVVPRAKRHPYATVEDPYNITNAVLADMARTYEEITDYSFGAKSPSTCTVPSSVSAAPNILVPRHFGIYAI